MAIKTTVQMVTSHDIIVGFYSFCEEFILIFMQIVHFWHLGELDTTLTVPLAHLLPSEHSSTCTRRPYIYKTVKYSAVLYVKSAQILQLRDIADN